MAPSPATVRLLARCNGFGVAARDDVVGTVATPVFTGTSLLPSHLIVRTVATIPGIFRRVPSECVAVIDARTKTVTLDLSVEDVVELDDLK